MNHDVIVVQWLQNVRGDLQKKTSIFKDIVQAGAELGQAQPKLGPELDLSNLNFVA